MPKAKPRPPRGGSGDGRRKGKSKRLDRSMAPMSSIPDMFAAMFSKAVAHSGSFARRAAQPGKLTLVVATVCSGTDAPLVALDLIREAAYTQSARYGLLNYRHVFSCEIEPHKQAFIRRNHDVPIIFRNVNELGAVGATQAMDASGIYRDIPTEKLDLLIAGTSCVDFSTLNTCNKKDQKTQVEAFIRVFNPTNDKKINDEMTGKTKMTAPVANHRAAVFSEAVQKQLSPEGLVDLGESMTTFLSTLNFIMERKPRMVIFENVQTAPWVLMQNFWLPYAGYAAEFVKVDSKDFHVPQDRCRGYLVALHVQEFDLGAKKVFAANLVTSACQHASGLKQRASASVLDFVMDEDDTSYLQARDEIGYHGSHGQPKDGKRGGKSRHVDWDFCKLRHTIYSQRWNLDTERRFSRATLSHGQIVTITPPATAWIQYWARETPRVIDLWDNLYQQLLTRGGTDMNYKAAMFNISQNLDRMPITLSKLGIAPILTPHGMPTLSNLGRPLLGVECLTLQGIPKNRLRLAGESHRELRDLAGNAMTVTVVGAVILGTLMAVAPRLAKMQARAAEHGSEPEKTKPRSVQPMALVKRELTALENWNLGDFSRGAANLLQVGVLKVCRCAPVGSHLRTIYRCKCCTKLACELCKGNPTHFFEPCPHPRPTLDMADWKVQLQQALPGLFTMTLQAGVKIRCDRRAPSSYWAATEEVLKHNVFYFCGIKITTASAIVEYRSQQSIARLTLDRLGNVEWYVFGASSGKMSLSTPLVGARHRHTKPLANGIFRGVPSTVDPEAAEWCVWQPVKHTWRVAVALKTDDYFALDHRTLKHLPEVSVVVHDRAVLPHFDHPRLFVVSHELKTAVSSPPAHLEAHVGHFIRGVWAASPRCGTPAAGLYIRQTEGLLFCFKDVDPLGHPADDHYIISQDIELPGGCEYRGDEVKLEVVQMRDLRKTVKVSVPGYWQSMEPPSSTQQPGLCFKTQVYAPEKETDWFHITKSSTIAQPPPDPTGPCNERPVPVLEARVFAGDMPLSLMAKLKWTGTWHEVFFTGMDEFLKSILFTANALGKGPLFKPHDDGLVFDPVRGVPVQLCDDCCFPPPAIHWVKGSQRVVPWEDPSSVRMYLDRVRKMPEPFQARVRLDLDPALLCDPAEQPTWDENWTGPPLLKLGHSPSEYRHALQFRLAANPRTLASRAAANLVYGSRPLAFSNAMLPRVECSFQIEVGRLAGPNIHFARFYESIPTSDDTAGLGTVEFVAKIQPDSFRAAKKAGKKEEPLALYEDQERSVRWMLARERSPAPYLEMETEEVVLEPLNLRIVGRAVHPNDGSTFCCRGGIVAHEIGYGKTVVTIALLEHQRAFDTSVSLGQRRQAAAKFWGSEKAFMHLAATLIIVPDHITTQWKDEFAKFVPVDRDDIVIIRRYPELAKTSLGALEKAKVIIVATSIFNSTYNTALSLLTETRPSTGKSQREVEARYRTSLSTIRDVVRRYREVRGRNDDMKQEQAIDRAREVLAELNRKYEALCQQWSSAGGRKEANKKQRQGTKKAAAPEPMAKKTAAKRTTRPKPLWTATGFLENFSFARIVVDEFSYDNAAITLFLSNALASAKWLLSGTPRCGNLADIVHQGRLLSVHVARPDPRVPTYLDEITVGPRNGPTAATEDYRARSAQLRSHNFALDRHRSAEDFIRHFVRQDKVDLAKFSVTFEKVDLDLPVLSQVAYGGLSHDLALARGDLFSLPFGLRRSLGVATTYKYSGDNAEAGTKAADLMMARFAAVPMSAQTLKALLGASDLELRTLKNEIKTTMDKLLWLCHRLPLVDPALKDKYPRHHNLRTLIEDLFSAMADARNSWDAWPTAAFGGQDAFLQLTKAVCPGTAFRCQEGGLEDWLKWRFIDAQSFWVDWYDMPDSYIDGLASPERYEELLELSTDVVLLSISHPLGRSFARTGGVSWLDSHARALGRIMEERTRSDFLTARTVAATEQARAAAVRDTMPRFTTEQLIHFLKRCMEEKRSVFEVTDEDREEIDTMNKEDLKRHCASRNLRYAESSGPKILSNKILSHLQGYCSNKDFMDRRGVISPRADFPVPNLVFARRGGKTEAMLEEMTLTYNYLRNCHEAWIQAFRRQRLLNLLRFLQGCRYDLRVRKNCDACLRRPVCTGDVPGFVVLVCGHWLCEEHKREMDQLGVGGYCLARGCGAHCGLSQPVTIRLTEQELLSCPDIWDPKGAELCSRGGKVGRIAQLIEATPKDDKVILFIYIKELATEVRQQLEANGVSVLSMIGARAGANLAEDLEKFKKGKAKVIIIDPTAEHAAGSNLTIANHVIFASPSLERDPFLRQMHYRQAIGRCLRNGQEKKVNVYTLVTKGTIDEELYIPGQVAMGG